MSINRQNNDVSSKTNEKLQNVENNSTNKIKMNENQFDGTS